MKLLGEKKFLCGDEPSIVDFSMYEILDFFYYLTKGKIFLDYPTLEGYKSNIASLPGLKEYLEGDNEMSKYIFNNKVAQINPIAVKDW